MRFRLKGINSKRKKLADGSFKTYYGLGRADRRCAVNPARPNSWRATTKR